MNSDIRRILDSLFSQQIDIDDFGFVKIPNEVIETYSKPDTKISEPESNAEDPKIQVKKKCEVCKKRTGLDYFTCGEQIFCSNHRYHHTHKCQIDKKEEFKQILKENNPKVVCEKLERI